MKYLPAALALCAFAFAPGAFAQEVSCHSCDHVAPYFRGEGGFIGTAAEGVDEVVFVASCGSVTTTGQVEVEGDTVAQLFSHENGLACGRDDGGLEISGLEDGGWYWLTDDRNSAVGSLVGKDVLDNPTVEITSAGPGVAMTMGRGAVYLKETATGRVGILPNILPRPPTPAVEVCGPRRASSSPYAYDRQKNSECVVGTGRTKIRLTGPGAYGGRAEIANGTVTRPRTGSVTVTADLWVDESGSFTTVASTSDTYAVSVRKGWPGTTSAGQSDHGANWLDARFFASLSSGDAQAGDLDGAGVTLPEDGIGSTPAGQATLTIAPSADYCPAQGTRHTATVRIRAEPGADNSMHPPVVVGRDAHGLTAADLAGTAAITQLRIVCAPASNRQSGEQPPDDPAPAGD